MGEYILEWIDEIVLILMCEVGKLFWEVWFEIEGVVCYFEYYGNQVEIMEGCLILFGGSYFDFIVYEFFGVLVQIIFWNYFMEMMVCFVLVVLVVGCVVVVKILEFDLLINWYFVDVVLVCGLLVGMLNILCGFGKDVGVVFFVYLDVDQIVFIGFVVIGFVIVIVVV